MPVSPVMVEKGEVAEQVFEEEEALEMEEVEEEDYFPSLGEEVVVA